MALVRHFCATRAFDVVYYPGMTAQEANQYNLLDAPDFFAGVMALVGPARRDFSGATSFTSRRATDDRPYFSFLQVDDLPELMALHRKAVWRCWKVAMCSSWRRSCRRQLWRYCLFSSLADMATPQQSAAV